MFELYSGFLVRNVKMKHEIGNTDIGSVASNAKPWNTDQWLTKTRRKSKWISSAMVGLYSFPYCKLHFFRSF